MRPIDLHEVAQYWKSRGLMDERHLPYYVRWLQRAMRQAVIRAGITKPAGVHTLGAAG